MLPRPITTSSLSIPPCLHPILHYHSQILLQLFFSLGDREYPPVMHNILNIKQYQWAMARVGQSRAAAANLALLTIGRACRHALNDLTHHIIPYHPPSQTPPKEPQVHPPSHRTRPLRPSKPRVYVPSCPEFRSTSKRLTTQRVFVDDTVGAVPVPTTR